MGHSTRSADEFLDLLKQHAIERVADVRRYPASRRYPHFSRDTLAVSLQSQDIGYSWFEALGGRRRAAPGSTNTAWRNEAFRGYADYMQTAEFDAALSEVLALCERERTAIMCSEAVWWRCHRGLIADLLLSRGVQVLHITDSGAADGHPYTPAARLDQGQLTYDPSRGAPARSPGASSQPSLL